jgi:transcriptional regulator with PAS, ATPase and Fis domain
MSPDDPMNRAATSDTIIALRNTSTGEELALGPGAQRWQLGSKRINDLVVRDPWVSGVHCVLERRTPAGPLVVRDRGSRNGTFVAGVPVEAAVLRPGSMIGVGHTTLIAVAATGRVRRTALETLRGNDPRMRSAIAQALRAAQTDCSVLIVGETGTGKDLMARLIHEASGRAGGPFVAVNCGAIPRELIGSELFGHVRGAFTGAERERDGYFIEATGGTLFLDELAELPLEQQPHLLRVLENRKVRRIGGTFDHPLDARIVAATNRIEHLGTPMSRLRLDLFHRVATVVIALPPLRERAGDIRDLVLSMMAEHGPEHGRKEVSHAAWLALTTYEWPGNVRELCHAVARAMALGGAVLGPTDFLPDIAVLRAPMRTLHAHARTTTTVAPAQQHAADAIPESFDTSIPRLPPIMAVQRDAMADALNRFGSVRAAAKHLGMPKSTLADRARAWGIWPKKKPG